MNTRFYLIELLVNRHHRNFRGGLLPALSRAREAARRASCQNNQVVMGLVFQMYARGPRPPPNARRFAATVRSGGR